MDMTEIIRLEKQFERNRAGYEKTIKQLEDKVARYKFAIDTTESATGMSGIYARLDDEIVRLRKLLDDMAGPAEEVIRISDRKHDAWDKLKAAIAASERGA